MTGQASINGVDINTYGASLAKGTYDALNAEAPAKEYISNESRLQHGIRIVAEPENAKLDKREVTIKVLIEGRGAAFHSNVRSFLSAITHGLFTLSVPALGTTFNMVYQSCGKPEIEGKTSDGITMAVYPVKLLEPNPNNRT